MSESNNQVFYLAGYAGTGKTTLAKSLAEGVTGKVLFGAFTGKAALVLRKKGCWNATTIHSMIYKIDEFSKGWEPKFILNPDSPVRDAELVVIDECSMVGTELGTDLLSFGKKVLVIGDPAQLPPVKSAGFFTNREPDFMLTEVHRQAADNPIIAMSMKIREGGRLLYGPYGDSKVITRSEIDADQILAADQVLVGLNKTRHLYNDRIRALKGMDPSGPQVGDRLVCLRNNKEKRLLNGQLFEISKINGADKYGTDMLATSEDHIEALPTSIYVMHEFFRGQDQNLSWEDKRDTDEFHYGYALTCHKSQGSQWNNVVMFDEASAFREDAIRWRYTALTRAAERITVVM